MEIKINMPILITSFGDYHEIESAKDILRRIIPNVRVEEIDPEKYGFDFCGSYTALVYIYGNKPTKDEIKVMFSNAEFHEMEH